MHRSTKRRSNKSRGNNTNKRVMSEKPRSRRVSKQQQQSKSSSMLTLPPLVDIAHHIVVPSQDSESTSQQDSQHQQRSGSFFSSSLSTTALVADASKVFSLRDTRHDATADSSVLDWFEDFTRARNPGTHRVVTWAEAMDIQAVEPFHQPQTAPRSSRFKPVESSPIPSGFAASLFSPPALKEYVRTPVHTFAPVKTPTSTAAVTPFKNLVTPSGPGDSGGTVAYGGSKFHSPLPLISETSAPPTPLLYLPSARTPTSCQQQQQQRSVVHPCVDDDDFWLLFSTNIN